MPWIITYKYGRAATEEIDEAATLPEARRLVKEYKISARDDPNQRYGIRFKKPAKDSSNPGKRARAIRRKISHGLRQMGWRRTKTTGFTRLLAEGGSSVRRGRLTKAPAFRAPRKLRTNSTTLRNIAIVKITRNRDGTVGIVARRNPPKGKKHNARLFLPPIKTKGSPHEICATCGFARAVHGKARKPGPVCRKFVPSGRFV